MMNLRYKTRAGSAPNGKPRVYFCAHPEDFLIYFEELSNELLALWDCAIWYSDHAEMEEDSASYLEQMQLFVIPVSLAFLRDDNDARMKEFPFALLHHIPVLPILVNGGLASEFNKVCGNIQFLDRTSRDMTEISYAKKLETFLHSVLIPDEMAEKVRSAFDAYVFLSYRKKDRRYAQELMRLIHENEFCRDIAIWYDEFLTPGEDFNDSIQAALEKSDLFALAVTPNLVNEKNYVMEIEYPMARKRNKKILPVELCGTNRLKLKMHFRSMPSIISGNDRDALSASLKDAFRTIAVKETDQNPEHLLFVGLAYLGGIDVEVDPERGVRLITEAAENGLPQAMMKLRDLYHTGNGIAPDLQKAVFWQEKLAAFFRQKHADNEENRELLLDALRDLGELYAEAEQYGKLSEVCQEYQELLDKKKMAEPDVLRMLWLYSRRALVLEKNGDFAEARKLLLEYRNTAEEWRGKTSDRKAAVLLTVSYDRLGQLSMTEGNLQQALEMFRQGKRITEIMEREIRSTDAMSYRLTMGIQCGRVLKKQQNYAEAIAEYTAVLPTAERLAETGGSEDTRQLIACLEELGSLYLEKGDAVQAKKMLYEALQKARGLLEKEHTMANLHTLSVVCSTAGDTLLRTDFSPLSGEKKEIRSLYQESLQISKQLAERTGSAQALLDLAGAQDRMSRYEGLAGHRDKEHDLLLAAIGSAEKAAEISGDAGSMRALSGYLHRMGTLLDERAFMEEAEGKDARPYYERSFALHERIYEQTKSAEDRLELASDWQIRSRWAEEDGDMEKADADRKKSIRIVSEIAQENPSVYAYQNILAMYQENMNQMQQRCGMTQNRENTLLSVLKAAEELLEKDPTIQRKRSAAGRNFDIAEYYSNHDSWAKAWPYYQRYLALCGAEETNPQDSLETDLAADALDSCMAAAERCGEIRIAKELAEKECRLREQACRMNPDLNHYEVYARTNRILARLSLAEKNFEEAESYGTKYTEMIRNMPERYPEMERYHGKPLTAYAAERIWLLVQDFQNQGKTYLENKEPDAAEACYEPAVDYGEEAVKLDPENLPMRDRLAKLYWNMANVPEDGYYTYYLEQALETWEQLTKKDPDHPEYAKNAGIVRGILDGN